MSNKFGAHAANKSVPIKEFQDMKNELNTVTGVLDKGANQPKIKPNIRSLLDGKINYK